MSDLFSSRYLVSKKYKLFLKKAIFYYDNYAVVHSSAKGGQLHALL